MKISDMIKNLQNFMAEHGDLDCWYAVDDEGNDYHPVFYTPSRFYVNEHDDVFQQEDMGEDLTAICIVN